MQWLLMVLVFAIVISALAEPEPKKYKPQTKIDKQTNTSLSDDEKKFLREVEEKFGVKSDAPIEVKEITDNKDALPTFSPQQIPAVIAIEIVNDTDTKTKDKRTVDANLGYGYKTNGGYQYRYFGKPTQDKGKFMIYPYSQEDIPPAKYSTGYSQNSANTQVSEVEIQASRAYELKEVEDDSSYHYNKPAVEFKTKTPTTFYTTYNGGKFSGLSTQFPTVMPNYFVDPSQLLQNPQYQTAGLTQDHLRPHGSQLDQRVIPVLVLRIPSSYLKNPTAELYPNLPQNYPLSQHLNSVNIQELVNQYFSKLGYTNAPQVMPYLNQVASQINPQSFTNAGHQERQTYSSPYIRPTYTQADYSGVQYSAVQPVMAKFPAVGQNYYTLPRQSNHYQYQVEHTRQSAQPASQYYTQQQASLPAPNYYSQPEYQNQYQQTQQVLPQSDTETKTAEHTYPQYSFEQTDTSSANYPSQNELSYSTQTPTPQYDESEGAAQYDSKNEHQQYQTSSPSVEYSTSATDYSSNQAHSSTQIKTPYYQYQYEYQYPKQEDSSQQYYSPQVSQEVEKETVAIIPDQNIKAEAYSSLSQSEAVSSQYDYHKDVTENTSQDTINLSENYPSKDHTHATVLPYKTQKTNSAAAVQSVSYVTPVPYTQSYQSKYRMLVPQTVFKHTSEKVHYVNPQTLPASAVQIRYHGQNNPEEEYTVSPTYIPPIGRQKAPAYPRNYHSHPKRMTRPIHKESVTVLRKVTEKREEKNP